MFRLNISILVLLLAFLQSGCGGTTQSAANGSGTHSNISTQNGGSSGNGGTTGSGGGGGTSGTSGSGGDSNTSGTLDYSYLPKTSEITDAMAYKFLNMATFGATPELVKELKQQGIVKWVDEQLAMSYSEKDDGILRDVITLGLKVDINAYIRKNRYIDGQAYPKNITVDQFLDSSNAYCFNQNIKNGPNELYYHSAKLFDNQMRSKKQILQRVAYALSQIVIASQSNDQFFSERGEALSYYYDILQKDAFGKYGDLLYDISMSPTMATYLTYAGNQKEHTDNGVLILPDENYGREIMQLFSIGLFELNANGEAKRSNGVRIPTYTQEDVNEMSKVFTGLKYRYTKKFNDPVTVGDTTHSLECIQQYHDVSEKKVLGKTISAGGTCQKDIKSAIDILMNHPNIAPNISKKLILRLTKSNPKYDYISRVATVFTSTNGDLKATTKAILLDKEIWDNIKNSKDIKIKEPFIAYMNLLRALDAKPLPFKNFSAYDKDSNKITLKVKGARFYSRANYDLFGQWPTYSPSVFNYYNDDFIPDDFGFKNIGHVAPELEIITTKYAVNAYNGVLNLIINDSVQIKYDRKADKPIDPAVNPDPYKSQGVNLYFDYSDILDVFRKNGFGQNLDDKDYNSDTTREKVATALVDYISVKMLGKKLPDEVRTLMIQKHKDDYIPGKFVSRKMKDKEYNLTRYWIAKIIIDIYQTDSFMIH
jgi:uncharacterized protein (DUF1800 family)